MRYFYFCFPAKSILCLFRGALSGICRYKKRLSSPTKIFGDDHFLCFRMILVLILFHFVGYFAISGKSTAPVLFNYIKGLVGFF